MVARLLYVPLLCTALLGHAGHEGGPLSGLAIVAALQAEPAAFRSAEAVARELGRFVPGVEFQAATVKERESLATGLHSGELIMAVLTSAEAIAIISDEAGDPVQRADATADLGGRERAGPALRVLAHLRSGLLLVSDRSLGAEHAYMALFALYDPAGGGLLASEYREPAQMLARAAAYPVPLHVGAEEFLTGTAELEKAR